MGPKADLPEYVRDLEIKHALKQMAPQRRGKGKDSAEHTTQQPS